MVADGPRKGTKTALGCDRVACPLSLARPGETCSAGEAPREVPLGTHRLKLCVWTTKSPHCRRNTSRRTCPARTPAHAARGFASVQKERELYFDASKHMQEFEDVVRHMAAHPTWHRKAACTPCWNEGYSVHFAHGEEEEACDAFLATVWQHPDFELYADNGRTACTRVLRSVNAQLSASERCETQREGSGRIGWYPVRFD
eukprot:6457400-Amphidinium_carterae.1